MPLPPTEVTDGRTSGSTRSPGLAHICAGDSGLSGRDDNLRDPVYDDAQGVDRDAAGAPVDGPDLLVDNDLPNTTGQSNSLVWCSRDGNGVPADDEPGDLRIAV